MESSGLSPGREGLGLTESFLIPEATAEGIRMISSAIAESKRLVAVLEVVGFRIRHRGL